MSSTKVLWKEPPKSPIEHCCGRFEMKDPEGKTKSICPVYGICSTPCNPNTAKPLEKKPKRKYAIMIRFGRRNCRYFALFNENHLVAVMLGENHVFCPLTRHCKNACIWGPEEEKIKCKTNLEGFVSLLRAHEGLYDGEDTFR